MAPSPPSGRPAERDFSPRAKRDALLASPLFRPLHREELDGVVAMASELRVGKGAGVFARGDRGDSMMAVLAGRVRIGAVSPDGREVTLNVIGPGEIFGEIALLDGKPRSADATALEDSVLLVLERRRFMPFLLAHGDLVERLLGVLCERLRRTSLALEEIALLDLPVRLARLLLKLAADYGQPVAGAVRIGLKLSQHDLATQVASSRESINKQLRAWSRAGVVRREEGYLVIRDEPALRRLIG